MEAIAGQKVSWPPCWIQDSRVLQSDAKIAMGRILHHKPLPHEKKKLSQFWIPRIIVGKATQLQGYGKVQLQQLVKHCHSQTQVMAWMECKKLARSALHSMLFTNKKSFGHSCGFVSSISWMGPWPRKMRDFITDRGLLWQVFSCYHWSC